MKVDGSETLKLVAEIVELQTQLILKLNPIINPKPIPSQVIADSPLSASPLRDGLLKIKAGLDVLLSDIEL